MQPFSITLFATTGDPEGIRHLDKSNWSGCGKTGHAVCAEQSVDGSVQSLARASGMSASAAGQ